VLYSSLKTLFIDFRVVDSLKESNLWRYT
jgi:hypothetical protein